MDRPIGLAIGLAACAQLSGEMRSVERADAGVQVSTHRVLLEKTIGFRVEGVYRLPNRLPYASLQVDRMRTDCDQKAISRRCGKKFSCFRRLFKQATFDQNVDRFWWSNSNWDHWRLFEITIDRSEMFSRWSRDLWRSLEIVGNGWRSLEITGDRFEIVLRPLMRLIKITDNHTWLRQEPDSIAPWTSGPL